MPSRNLLRVDVADSYYHVYSRGVNSQIIFHDTADYSFFLSLLKRYLSLEPARDKNNVLYPHIHGEIEVLCFCLMPTHIHLLVYQNQKGALQKLMRGVMVSYGGYFNRKYKRHGPIFETRYKASLISDQTYLEHISRYIHLNPKEWRRYEYSSLPYFIGRHQAEWLMPAKIISLFSSSEEYLQFLNNYVDYKKMLDEVKSELAAG